ncbi:hypothetical protein BG011_009517 [Mortierella polycephala]|uniref:Uncharacterized protein n=1 Tax=Mortierella polycephala TaxID=41804 RepID=A0A9P6PM35_9FUNG|nr:hypothetical protein BG011_009517 [Mortierella polycephala]
MTLISTPSSLNNLYNNNNNNSQSTEDNYSLTLDSVAPALSWHPHQPETFAGTSPSITTSASTSTRASQKYRTLASIQAQTLFQQQQQQLRNLYTPPISPISTNSPSASTSASGSSTTSRPGPLDNLTFKQQLEETTTVQHHNPHHSYNHYQQQPSASASSITAAIQEMDASHGTCFLSWIHSPTNLDYISLRLRPLCLEYPLADVANVLRWIGADWSSTDCKALFRAVTQSWDQAKRRMLAFLLIRDEEMRQRAKSKLVEFAKKSNSNATTTTTTKSKSFHYQQQLQHQIRRSILQRQPQQPQQQQQQQRRHRHHQSHLPQSNIAAAQLPQVPVVPKQIISTTTTTPITTTPTATAATAAGWTDLATLQSIIAASMITGDFDSITEQPSSPVCAPSSTTIGGGSIYGSRYSPY